MGTYKLLASLVRSLFFIPCSLSSWGKSNVRVMQLNNDVSPSDGIIKQELCKLKFYQFWTLDDIQIYYQRKKITVVEFIL